MKAAALGQKKLGSWPSSTCLLLLLALWSSSAVSRVHQSNRHTNAWRPLRFFCQKRLARFKTEHCRGRIGLLRNTCWFQRRLWCNALGFARDNEALFGSYTRTAFILFYPRGNPNSAGPHAVWISLKCRHMSLSAQVFHSWLLFL